MFESISIFIIYSYNIFIINKLHQTITLLLLHQNLLIKILIIMIIQVITTSIINYLLIPKFHKKKPSHQIPKKKK
jgi:hypothetical protein